LHGKASRPTIEGVEREDVALMGGAAVALSPLTFSYGLWALWALSWAAAAAWSRRTGARPAPFAQLAYLVPTIAGALLIAEGANQLAGRAPDWGAGALWRPPQAVSWALTAICVAGFAFTWWARLTLGDLWSSSVQRKHDHTIVQSGPYGLVRHPIYTGLIVSLVALALQIGESASLLGAAVLGFGFWMKARLEERFLAAELGQSVYAEYRRRTPMLVPFWPKGET